MADRLLDHPVISERYFFPRREPLPGATRVVLDGGEELACHRAGAGPRCPWVLHFHGNGEIVADWIELAEVLVEAGVGAFLAEYRGYGGSSGRPALDALLDDALVVADHAATGVPWERLVVYGRSIGSLAALHVAANRPVGGLILESGIADLLERLEIRLHPSELGVDAPTLRAAVSARFDHEAKLAATRCPVVVLHTTHDHLVHVSHAHRLAAWAGARGRLVEYPRGDHNSIFAHNGAAIVEEIVALARRAGEAG